MKMPVDKQRFIETLALSLPELVYVVNVDETAVSYRNRDFIAQLGFPEDTNARGLLSLRDLVHPYDVDSYLTHNQAVRRIADGAVVEATFRLKNASAQWQWFHLRSVVFRRDEAGEVVEIIRTIHDVSAQMRSETQLREMVRQLRVVQIELQERQEQLQELNLKLAALATTDGLTGLYNYRAFHEKLEEETRRALRHGFALSVVIADVDDFKAYNDRFGHPAGDERLRLFARMLLEESRESDFVARYGGEEFAMILVNTDEKDATRYVERIIDRLNEEKGFKSLTASFGCVQLEPQDESKEDLVRRADDCLYSAKHQGKNRVVVWTKESKSVPVTY